MAKQILKGSAMLVLLVVLALATAVASANGQTSSRIASAEIPFDFIIGEKTLPSGKYTVTTMNNAGDALLVSNSEAPASAVRLTSSTERARGKATAKLVFHRYGHRYFLAEVWSGESEGRRLVKSKQERAIERELAAMFSKNDLAMNTYERIEVLATGR